MGILNERIISEMGIISDEVYDNDPSGIKYFKENPSEMLVETSFGITSYTVIDYTSSATDMQALLLKKSGTNEYIIAFRGTETDSLFDIGVDAIIGLNENYRVRSCNQAFWISKCFAARLTVE